MKSKLTLVLASNTSSLSLPLISLNDSKPQISNPNHKINENANDYANMTTIESIDSISTQNTTKGGLIHTLARNSKWGRWVLVNKVDEKKEMDKM